MNLKINNQIATFQKERGYLEAEMKLLGSSFLVLDFFMFLSIKMKSSNFAFVGVSVIGQSAKQINNMPPHPA